MSNIIEMKPPRRARYSETEAHMIDRVVAQVFERIREALVPDMSPDEYELKTGNVRREAREAFAVFYGLGQSWPDSPDNW